MTFPVLTTSLDLLRRVAAGVPADRLEDPTPCSQWTVAQVLLHAAGDQHGWASFVGSSPLPSYDPFAPPHQLDGTVDALIGRGDRGGHDGVVAGRPSGRVGAHSAAARTHHEP